jgi:hypothetical protein
MFRRLNEQGICSICGKEHDFNHTTRCERTQILRDESLDKTLKIIDAKKDIR